MEQQTVNCMGRDFDRINEERNFMLHIQLDDEREKIETIMIGEDGGKNFDGRFNNDNYDSSIPKYENYNFAICLDGSDNRQRMNMKAPSSPKMRRPSLHVIEEDANIRKQRSSLSAPNSRSRTPSPRPSITPSPQQSPFSSPIASRTTSPEMSPSAERRVSRTSSLSNKDKIKKKARKVGFSHYEYASEGTDTNDSKKATAKQRKYSLPFFKWDKKETNEKSENQKKTRSISVSQIDRPPPQEFYLEYDLNAMRRKSCIALTNPILKDEKSLKESVQECTNLVKAIEIAAFEIGEREIKKQRKNSKHDIGCVTPDNCIKSTLEEYKKSEIMISTEDRLDSRRKGISERCEIERELVKQSLKYLIQNEFITLYKD